MPSVEVQPSQTEVNAIKQQLKLLGHTLPTDVIVKFLQQNSGLLTAYQLPDSSLQQLRGQVDDYTPADSIQGDGVTDAEPGLAARVIRPVAQTIPKLDVTWASAAPSRHLRSGRPVQGPSGSGQIPYDSACTLASAKATQASTVREDVCDQHLCFRDGMSKAIGNTSVVAPSLGHVSSNALESDFYSLKAELDELGAALRRPQHSSTSHTQLDTCMQQQGDFTSMQQQGFPHSMQQGFPTRSASQPHAMFQREPVSSRQRWASATELPFDRRNEPLQHAQRGQHAQQNGNAHTDSAFDDNVHDFAAGMYQQQERHSQSGRTAQHTQLHSSCQHDDTARAGGGLGSKRSSSRGGHFPSPGPMFGCSSVRSSPVLNNSFIVPAQAVKPKKVDRVTRHRELQQLWNKDAFLRSGGMAKACKRQGEKFNELYAACHAAEDKLKDLTLKHGKAAKGVARSRAQQENVAPTEKRRDALRWETRMRMQLRDDHF